MKKIVHLIPYDATGGVEIAARTMKDVRPPDLDFSVQSIYAHIPAYEQRQDTFGVRPLLDALRRTRSHGPDLLIVSLWRACIVGLLLKFLRPQTRLVLMLHSTKDAHWLDKAITRATGHAADEWWGDSCATLNERLPGRSAKVKRVISFVTRHLDAVASPTPSPQFIFWGRVSSVKGLDRALLVFAKVARSHPDAHFKVIGPDGGALADLRAMVARMGLNQSVSFLGDMNIAAICSEARAASFYLQASKYEGMAMSVVEAMQLGLVPIVTPVGEIGNYCRDRENGILIQSDADAVATVEKLLVDHSLYRKIQSRAAERWRHEPVYADAMLEACRSALAVGGTAPD